MAWLDDIRGDQGPAPFTATVDMLVPVMSRGAVAAEGPRKADLLAHLGWADFLRWRDGQRGLEPAARYRQAMAVDAPKRVRPCHAGALDALERWKSGGCEPALRHRTEIGSGAPVRPPPSARGAGQQRTMTRPISTCFESRTT